MTNLSDLGAIRLNLNGQGIDTRLVVSGAGDFNWDGFRDVVVGVPNFYLPTLNGTLNDGVVFIVSGNSLQEARKTIELGADDFNGVVVLGHEQMQLGNSLAEVGDVNADGFHDLAIGTGTQKAGYVLYGQSEPPRIISLKNLRGQGVAVAKTGHSVSSAGDFNGDGFPDVLFGNPYSEERKVEGENSVTNYFGRVTLLFGSNSLSSQIDALLSGTNHISISSRIGNSFFGRHLAGGFDMNHDGFSDILVVSPKGGNNLDGAAFLIHGNPQTAEQVDYAFVMDNARHYVRHAGDLNGDGHSDLIFGRELEKKEWSIYILWGGDHLSGVIDLEDELDPKLGTNIVGAQSAYNVGDINGDGFSDLAIAMPHATVDNKVEAGRVIFLFGRDEWPYTVHVPNLVSGKEYVLDYIVVDGGEAFDVFGSSVAGVGDIQGDGFEDVVVSAPTAVMPGESNRLRTGSAFVIQGINLHLSMQNQRSVLKPYARDNQNNAFNTQK